MAALPAFADAYDPRGTERISAVRSQGTSGSCWAFAALACAEADLISQGKEGAGVDLSESAFVMSSGAEMPFSQAGSAALAQLLMALQKGVCYDEFEPFFGNCQQSAVVSAEKMRVCEYGLSESYEIAPEDVKAQVKEHGAVYVSQYYNKAYLSGNGKSYYCPVQDVKVNHAAAVIGWDDEYSRENFKDLPENDGAWLIKGSWGAQVSDDGCYWVSYEDKGLSGFTVFGMTEPADSVYSRAARLPAVNLSANGEISGANIFTAESDITLDRAGFLYLSDGEADYELTVCTGVSSSSPVGKTAAKASGTVTSKGFFTADFDPVTIKKGERFSVSVKLVADTPALAAQRGKESTSGVSFVKTTGSWRDLSADSLNASTPYIFAYASEQAQPYREQLRAVINDSFADAACEREMVYALEKYEDESSSARELKNARDLVLSAAAENDEDLIIRSVSDWRSFAKAVSSGDDMLGKTVVLAADIDFGGMNIAPVGNDENGFAGMFDARGHILKNAVIDSGDSEYSGLFARLEKGASVIGTTLENVRVLGMTSGGICGISEAYEIKRCAFYGSVTGADRAGLLAGASEGTVFTDCIAGDEPWLSQKNIVCVMTRTDDTDRALSLGWELRDGVMTQPLSVLGRAYGFGYLGSFTSGSTEYLRISCGIMERLQMAVIKAAIDELFRPICSRRIYPIYI